MLHCLLGPYSVFRYLIVCRWCSKIAYCCLYECGGV